MFPKLLLAAALTLSSGCSLVLVDGPPNFIPAGQPIPAGACTVSKTLPFVDAVGATALVATAATSSDGDVVRLNAVLGVLLGYSSYAGFRKVRQCRQRTFMPDGPRPDTALARYLPEFTRFPSGPMFPPNEPAEPPL